MVLQINLYLRKIAIRWMRDTTQTSKQRRPEHRTFELPWIFSSKVSIFVKSHSIEWSSTIWGSWQENRKLTSHIQRRLTQRLFHNRWRLSQQLLLRQLWYNNHLRHLKHSKKSYTRGPKCKPISTQPQGTHLGEKDRADIRKICQKASYRSKENLKSVNLRFPSMR